MADRPILFSGPMVRALIAGTKTQTRRALNPQPMQNSAGLWTWKRPGVSVQSDGLTLALAQRIAVGDRLYVRESWNWTFIKDLAPGESVGRTLDECCEANGGFACPVGDGIVYAATNAHEHPEFGKARWKPSIHMPRYASRITLTVTDVRVERLQDISEANALAEGIVPVEHRPGGTVRYSGVGAKFGLSQHTAKLAYAHLWDTINGEDAWAANPWVAAYIFTVQMGNIDQLRAAA